MPSNTVSICYFIYYKPVAVNLSTANSNFMNENLTIINEQYKIKNELQFGIG